MLQFGCIDKDCNSDVHIVNLNMKLDMQISPEHSKGINPGQNRDLTQFKRHFGPRDGGFNKRSVSWASAKSPTRNPVVIIITLGKMIA